MSDRQRELELCLEDITRVSVSPDLHGTSSQILAIKKMAQDCLDSDLAFTKVIDDIRSKNYQIKELEQENAELKQQLKDMKLRNKLLRDRPDLPVERLEAYAALRVEIATIRKSHEINLKNLSTQNEELVAHCDYLADVLSDIEIEDDIPHHVQELCLNAMGKTPKKSLAEIQADAIKGFKAHVISGLKVLNEPGWHNKRELVIDDNTRIEIMLSEFDDYANQLREKSK